MTTHAVDYVKVRTPAGTLQTNVPAVEEALAARAAGGYRLVSTVADTYQGDLMGVLLLFVKEG